MKYLPVTAAGLALCLSTPVVAASYDDTWVLLGLDIHMGAVTTRTFPDLPTPAHGEGLPTFRTKAACERALAQIRPWHDTPGRAMRRVLLADTCAQTGGLGQHRGINHSGQRPDYRIKIPQRGSLNAARRSPPCLYSGSCNGNRRAA